jgi:hypothetical protein
MVTGLLQSETTLILVEERIASENSSRQTWIEDVHVSQKRDDLTWNHTDDHISKKVPQSRRKEKQQWILGNSTWKRRKLALSSQPVPKI